MQKALGIIEAIGKTSAVAAVDAACKAADVTLLGVENIIGVETLVGVNVMIAGEVAAVQAAVEAGEDAAKRVGMIAASKVIARPHDEIEKLINKFKKNTDENIKNKEKIETKEKKESGKKEAKNKKTANN